MQRRIRELEQENARVRQWVVDAKEAAPKVAASAEIAKLRKRVKSEAERADKAEAVARGLAEQLAAANALFEEAS